MTKKSKIVAAVIVLIIVVGGAFYTGMTYGKNQAASSSSTAFSSGRAGFAGRAGRTAGAGFTTGTIISESNSGGATSIVLQLPASTGGSKIIYFSDATQIIKTVAGTASDLKTGTSVSVTGTANADGSETAQSIQIRPAGQPGANQGGPNIPAQ